MRRLKEAGKRMWRIRQTSVGKCVAAQKVAEFIVSLRQRYAGAPYVGKHPGIPKQEDDE